MRHSPISPAPYSTDLHSNPAKPNLRVSKASELIGSASAMIDRCFNPDCRRKLLYLRDGRVVRVITGKGELQSLEHFWLCGPCYEEYNFAFPPSGEVILEHKSRIKQSEEFHFGEVVIGGGD